MCNEQRLFRIHQIERREHTVGRREYPLQTHSRTNNKTNKTNRKLQQNRKEKNKAERNQIREYLLHQIELEKYTCEGPHTRAAADKVRGGEKGRKEREFNQETLVSAKQYLSISILNMHCVVGFSLHHRVYC